MFIPDGFNQSGGIRKQKQLQRLVAYLLQEKNSFIRFRFKILFLVVFAYCRVVFIFIYSLNVVLISHWLQKIGLTTWSYRLHYTFPSTIAAFSCRTALWPLFTGWKYVPIGQYRAPEACVWRITNNQLRKL